MIVTKFKVTKKDLENYQEYFNLAADYPAYCSTSGLSKVDGILIAKLLENTYSDGEYEVTITAKK